MTIAVLVILGYLTYIFIGPQHTLTPSDPVPHIVNHRFSSLVFISHYCTGWYWTQKNLPIFFFLSVLLHKLDFRVRSESSAFEVFIFISIRQQNTAWCFYLRDSFNANSSYPFVALPKKVFVFEAPQYQLSKWIITRRCKIK